ncbi:GAF sensor domain-containing protein [Desulfonema limicola]|uniref:GAF sensor domain-containing protein n=1 Tax=Desulfonema limicola TaxID=45656 RepID=A0A975B8W6_9BACT|nr:GAF domain-containing protein [Desulfonema limicola]QTA80950.1 GAF sensor domain-containing protein [Desulfonema limicola]
MSVKKDYFKTFCNISKAFGTTLKKEDLLELIVQSAIDSMDGKAACLFLANEKEDVFEPVCQKGLSDNYLHSDPYKGKKIVSEILEGGYLAFHDVSSDSRMENKEAKRAEGIASILVVPVIVESKAIGVLSLYTSTVREFSQDEIDFLSALAEQGGIAIHNARLMERIKQNAVLFHDMASSINSSLDVKQILHILTADIAEAFGMKGVNIRLHNEDAGTLELVSTYGFSEEFINKGPVETDKSIVEALEGETIYIRDAATDDRVQYREAMKKEGIKSMLCVPIPSGEKIIGVMRLCSDIEREFSEDMIILVEALANQGGIAIQNASMYLSLQEDKKNLEEDIWSHRLWF